MSLVSRNEQNSPWARSSPASAFVAHSRLSSCAGPMPTGVGDLQTLVRLDAGGDPPIMTAQNHLWAEEASPANQEFPGWR
jgi:hypothetical protein